MNKTGYERSDSGENDERTLLDRTKTLPIRALLLPAPETQAAEQGREW